MNFLCEMIISASIISYFNKLAFAGKKVLEVGLRKY